MTERLHKRRLEAPIILLGTGRCGTTLLGNIFERHPDVAYWPEPRPVWMHGHAYRTHHELGSGDLTPRIARYIDRRFARFTARAGASRFAEKTPSNCLRVPFIQALYPDCRVIHVIRDGREAVASTVRIASGPLQSQRMWARFSETALWEWPAYVPMFFRTFWRTLVLRKPARYWGPKPRGWEAWLDLPDHVIAARQWTALMEAALRDGRALPEGNYREVRFETLAHEPEATVAELLEFAGLSRAEEVLAWTRANVDASFAKPKARTLLSDEQLAEVERITGSLLDELGYR